MNKKQGKVLAGLDVLELVLSTIGFITCCMVFVLTKINERYFFYMMAFLLGINIIGQIKKIEANRKQPRIIKYSKRLIEPKSLKKVSL